MPHPLKRPAVLATLAALGLSSGCGGFFTHVDPRGTGDSPAPGMSTGTGTGTTSPGAGQSVTFSLRSNPLSFAQGARVTVTVWDAEQLAIADATAGCSVSMGADGQETVSCPAGVTYRKPAPETFEFDGADFARNISFGTRSVSVGERYRVSLRGKAADNCNTASGSAEGVAKVPVVDLGRLELAQTEMACGSPPSAQ